MGNKIVEINNISKYYGKFPGIENVTFSVEKGEIFGYLGPNGAGKTTTIRVLLGLLMHKNGQIKVFGSDLKKNLKEILKKTGYLPGELSLYDNLTVIQYLSFFSSLTGTLDLKYINSLAERFKLDIDRKISALSTGNRQKIGVIQAVMARPELIIMDEPTRGLDPLMRHEFYDLLREIKKEGRTIFLSSHVLSEVERICDRVGIVRNGRMVAIEDVMNLRRKKYKRVEIFCRNEIDKAIFKNIKNISHLQISGKNLRCHVWGDLDSLIKAVNKFYIVDISSEYPGLEEIFMKFYSEEKDV